MLRICGIFILLYSAVSLSAPPQNVDHKPKDLDEQNVYLQSEAVDVGPDVKKISNKTAELLLKYGLNFQLRPRPNIKTSRTFAPLKPKTKAVSEKLKFQPYSEADVADLPNYTVLKISWFEPKDAHVYYLLTATHFSRGTKLSQREIVSRKQETPLKHFPAKGINQFPHGSVAQKTYLEISDSLAAVWE